MTTIRTNRTARISAALGAAVLAALCCAPAGPAQAAPAPPQLSIALDDGRDSAAPSDELAYALEVTNLGTRPIKDLIISQTVPEGAALGSTDPSATEKARTLSWSVDIRPGKTVTMSTTITVAQEVPEGLLRLATVACARTSDEAAPLVCASDSNQLPAGAAADEQRQELEQPATAGVGWWSLPGAFVLVGAVLALLVATLLVLRRRGHASPAGEPARAAVDPVERVPSSSR